MWLAAGVLCYTAECYLAKQESIGPGWDAVVALTRRGCSTVLPSRSPAALRPRPEHPDWSPVSPLSHRERLHALDERREERSEHDGTDVCPGHRTVRSSTRRARGESACGRAAAVVLHAVLRSVPQRRYARIPIPWEGGGHAACYGAVHDKPQPLGGEAMRVDFIAQGAMGSRVGRVGY